jgi:hypothetical protein
MYEVLSHVADYCSAYTLPSHLFASAAALDEIDSALQGFFAGRVDIQL